MSASRLFIIAIVINLIFIGAYLGLSSTRADAAKPAAPKPAAAAAPAPTAGAEWDLIRQREQELHARELQLKQLEAELNAKIKQLSQLDAAIRRDLDQYRVTSDERIKHLVKIYSSMKPKPAGTLMNTLDSDVATEVMRNMKGEIAGQILAQMDPIKAAAITKNLAVFKRNLPTPETGAPAAAVPAAP